MAEYVTKHDLKTALAPVETRLSGVESRLDGVENRLDRVENRLDRVEDRLTGVENRLSPLEEMRDDIKAVLVQNEQMNTKIEAVLEYVVDMPKVKTRVTRLEETVGQEQAKTELNRLHIKETYHDLQDHKRSSHAAG